MALVIPENGSNWILTITNSLGGISGVSHIALGLDLNTALDQTITNRIANLFRDGLKSSWDSGWSVGPVKALEGPAPYNVWEDATVEACTGTAADYTAPAMALVVSKKTGIAGRAYRGRIYHPGVPETLVDESGAINATYRGNMQTQYDSLLTSLNGDAAVDRVVLFHDEDSPVSGMTEITSFLVRSVAGNQRPRQRRS